ncbi:TetR/AcrR family transcriptional regulator [Amycolatopsis taiwanensis]|uniref:TetR/AcrR family transcriptional regulator n=1 Tax=Amycolatopsis taiwanensis TaxID=342230 RepID=UPI0004AE855F|nr:TetR family transcriptional regulator [Amycolatopsis taiwanensis]
MAWDIERTKRRLLDAAAEEFCERGLAGARVDRIAAAAGVNKERIYQYFGKKDQLFATVISREVTALGDAVHIDGEGPQAVIDYAERFFDHVCRKPALARLLFWESLELGIPVAEPERRQSMRDKIAGIRRAVPRVSESQARELLSTILSLCYSWQALPTLDRLATGDPAPRASRQRQRRKAIGRLVSAALTSATVLDGAS